MNETKQQSTNLNSIQRIFDRLKKGRNERARFVASHIDKGIAYQIRALRDSQNLSQEKLAELVDMNQNAISRLESPERGRPTITTLKRLAEAFDVALVVRFIPFSQLAHWVSGTPFVDSGLSTASLAVPDFDNDHGFTHANPVQWNVVTVGQNSLWAAPIQDQYNENFWGLGIKNVYALSEPIHITIDNQPLANPAETQNQYAIDFYKSTTAARPTEKMVPDWAVQPVAVA